MREVRDTTGRFSVRPHYEPEELDRASEKVLQDFFRPTHGEIPIPIATDDLTRLIERDVSDFDPGVDLSRYGTDVEGVTEFLPGKKPRVRISAELAYDERRENRYRTTLTHEYGHVHFHAYLFAMEPRGADLFGAAAGKPPVCKRQTIINAPKADWMEWQACHVCGALLMPISALKRVVGDYQEHYQLFGPAAFGSPHAAALIERVRVAFHVSADAARVRLIKLNFLAGQDQGKALFG
ncbi:MAG TPA: ImmA/IrrE family metallo-endopeptidase [Stellaceae bacterium]|nr:ImmA/IrrE family metallo-endopeptidase [Stellaceae bacterium]